jgi:hypothetical protein
MWEPQGLSLSLSLSLAIAIAIAIAIITSHGRLKELLRLDRCLRTFCGYPA